MITTKLLKMDFTKTPNDLLRDISLSAGAFRVYVYLASKPSDWGVNNKDIKTQLGIGGNRTISNFLKELIDSGWIERIKQPRENGRFSAGYDYILNTKPSCDIDRIRQKWNDDKVERRKSGAYSNTNSTKTNNSKTNLNNKTKKKEGAQKESINNSNVKKEEKKKEPNGAKKEKKELNPTAKAFRLKVGKKQYDVIMSLSKEDRQTMIDAGLKFHNKMTDWLEWRRESRKPYGIRGIKDIVKNLKLYGSERMISAWGESISNEYQGYFPKKVTSGFETKDQKRDKYKHEAAKVYMDSMNAL